MAHQKCKHRRGSRHCANHKRAHKHKRASSRPGARVRVGAPGPAVNCTVKLSAGRNIQHALSRARPGAVVCLNAGDYGSVTIHGISPSARVTLAPVPGARVVFRDLTVTGAPSSNLTVQGFHIPGGVDDETGSPGGLVFQYDTISRNAHGYGFYFDAGGNGAGGTQTGIQIRHNRIDHVGECLAVTRGADNEHAFTFSHNICGPGIGYHDTESTQPGHYIEIGGIVGVKVDNNAFVGPADPNAASVGLHLNVFHIFNGARNVDFSNNIMWHTQTIGQALLFQEGHYDNVTIDNNLDVEDPACDAHHSDCRGYSFWTADDRGLSFSHNTVIDSYYGVLLTESQTGEDYGRGTGYQVVGNIVVGTVEGPDISFGECSGSCVFDDNVTDDRSARKAHATHAITRWKPRWTLTGWAPKYPYSRPPGGYYRPIGLRFAAGYAGSIGP
ncbi:MAG TPA: hypothetical protein VFW09_14860 [Solirubrobacteraceae bacterium]|nr:hypothetical protein [Solirubrobacteraceae bacterium]